MGCQHSTGRFAGLGHERNVLELVAAVRRPWGDVVVLAVVGEGGLVEGLEEDLHLLLEQCAVCVGVRHRRAEHLHLARVVAAPDSEQHAAACEYVYRSEVLSQSERVPHGGDVEAAAELDALGEVCEVEGQHEYVGDALVPLALEVVLGQPEYVVAALVHGAGYRRRLVEHRRQVLVGQPAVVHRRPVEADIVEVNVAGVEVTELLNHGSASPWGDASILGPLTGLSTARFLRNVL